MKSVLLSIAISTLSLLLVSAAAAGDANAGKAKSALCATCHGADGNSVNPQWPKLAGQHASYIEKQLNAYRSGERENETMQGMVASLSDEDVSDLAAYFSRQPLQRGLARGDMGTITLGEKIYRGGNAESGVAACMACHGPGGSGNPAAVFPALGGQHATYTGTTLKAFKAGNRNNDPNAMMRTVAGNMTEREIEAVAAYMEGLY
jgi:cytochrome c553